MGLYLSAFFSLAPLVIKQGLVHFRQSFFVVTMIETRISVFLRT